MANYEERISYNCVRKAKESLSKAIEWIDKIEQDKGIMLISQARKLADIYNIIKKVHIEIIVLEKDILKTN